MRIIGDISTRYPKTIILIVVFVTAYFLYQFNTKSFIETDPSKFIPTDIEAVKNNDYYRKNYSYRDTFIIGIEAREQGVMNPVVLRAIEGIVDEMKALKTRKTIDSKLTGKTETIELPIGIDIDDINSVSGLEDGILDKETGAVVTGSVIKKLKEESGIFFTEENEAALPQSDEDLLKIIPPLQDHVLQDRLFRGNMLSTDGKATAIHVPMINKWDYKRRYTNLELETALDPEMLKARLQGKTSFFPYDVYGKTIDGVVYDDAYIAGHCKNVSEKLRAHLIEYLGPATDQYPELEALLSRELTRDRFRQIINVTQKRDFFLNPNLATWDLFTSKLWDFTLERIDPLSYENLEFYLPHVEKIVDLLEVYDRTQEILSRYAETAGCKTYVAGTPLMIATMLRIISRDMGVLLPIGLIVILLMLAISFKSVKGVAIPLITVILSVIWTYGFMAMTGTPITSTTSNVPIVLLAVGSAYGIHLLNRYLEEARKLTDRRQILRRSIAGVGVAIVMAGITTFAGFISLSSTSMLMIRHYSVFSAFGIVVALLLTLTLSPAILCYWKLPRQKKSADEKKDEAPSGVLESVLVFWSTVVKKYPKTVIVVFALIAVVCVVKIKNLEFEGSPDDEFKKDHPIRQSTDFINRYLIGVGEIKLLFTFRDRVNLENEWVQDQLHQRSEAFAAAWRQLFSSKALGDDPVMNDFVGDMMQRFRQAEPDDRKMDRAIALMNDLLNEEYVAEKMPEESLTAPESAGSDLDALSENDDSASGLDGLAELAETAHVTASLGASAAFGGYNAGQISGLKELNRRLGQPEENWERTGESIARLRDLKQTPMGTPMVRSWNELQDLFVADVKQPFVLHKLEALRQQLFALHEPKVDRGDAWVGPTGFVMGPVDLIRKTYSLFYHDGNPGFRKIPDTRTDNLGDARLTDRGVIGVALNQAQNSDREGFDRIVSPDFKEFQFSIAARKTLTTFNTVYVEEIKEILAREFPEDNPYIESISLGGHNMEIMALTSLVIKSQITSIAQAIVFIFIVTFFIFRSSIGGLFSLIPLLFTIMANFGMILLMGWKIHTATAMVAAISLGIGIDYTIHFLERFKAQLRQGDTFEDAYLNTIRSTGKAIIINAASVAAGFSVLALSVMAASRLMGILMVGTMAYSAIAALTLLPALIFVTKPKFLAKLLQTG